jgi:hypothetical protein
MLLGALEIERERKRIVALIRRPQAKIASRLIVHRRRRGASSGREFPPDLANDASLPKMIHFALPRK